VAGAVKIGGGRGVWSGRLDQPASPLRPPPVGLRRSAAQPRTLRPVGLARGPKSWARPVGLGRGSGPWARFGSCSSWP